MIIRRRLLCMTQQRLFHHAISTFQSNYTRTALRRLKKPELVSLAGQHQMDSTGTKNELIDRLLTTPSQQQQSKDNTLETKKQMDTKSASSTPPTSTPPLSPPQQQSMDTKTVDTTDSELKPPLPEHHTISTTAVDNHGIINFEEDDIDGYDQQWVEAFDLKVGNRRGGSTSGEKVNGFRHARPKQPQQPSTSSTTHPGYVHQTLGDPANEKQLAGRSSPHRPTMEDTDVNTALPTATDNEDKLEFSDPEINQHWVNAFDQRVKTRTKIRDLDTLSANPRVGSVEQYQDQTDTKTNDDDSKDSLSSNKPINIVIGSSLAIWYIMGGEGIQSAISSFFS